MYEKTKELIRILSQENLSGNVKSMTHNQYGPVEYIDTDAHEMYKRFKYQFGIKFLITERGGVILYVKVLNRYFTYDQVFMVDRYVNAVLAEDRTVDGNFYYYMDGNLYVQMTLKITPDNLNFDFLSYAIRKGVSLANFMRDGLSKYGY